MSHIRSNHIDKTKATVIRTFANPVKDCALKLYAKILIIILIKFDEFLFPVRMLDKELDFLVCHRKTKINDITQGHVVYREDLIPRHKLQFLGNTVLYNTQYNARI